MTQGGVSTAGVVRPPGVSPLDWTYDTGVVLGWQNGHTGWLTVDDGTDIICEDTDIGYNVGATGYATITGAGTTWTHVPGNSGNIVVGQYGHGTLNITDGAVVSNERAKIAYGSNTYPDPMGWVTVSGAGSTWNAGASLYVGNFGDATLDITNGGAVHVGTRILASSYLCRNAGSRGRVRVAGEGSTWSMSYDLNVGYLDGGRVIIDNGGLVRVGHVLTIDNDLDGDSRIIMASGGMLSLAGNAPNSLGDYLGLIGGTDKILYNNGSAWADITEATDGVDYTLDYQAGYTTLTVTATPEPATMILMATSGLALLRRRRK
jgi:T5SS/PEP-CTERM-associated repeat protein